MSKFKLNTENNQPIADVLEQIEYLDIFSEKAEKKIYELCIAILQANSTNIGDLQEEVVKFRNLMKALQVFKTEFILTLTGNLLKGLAIRYDQLIDQKEIHN